MGEPRLAAKMAMRRVPRLNRFSGRAVALTGLQVADLCLEPHEAHSRALLIISVLCLLGIGLDFVTPDISIIEGLQDRLFKHVAA